MPDRSANTRIVSIIPGDYLIAQTGSIIVTDGRAGSRKAYTNPDILLVMARADQIVVGLKEAMQRLNTPMGKGASQAVILTGTSRSYDIEQEIVQGVFGPRQIAVFLVDD